MKYTNLDLNYKLVGLFIGEIFLDITDRHIEGIYPYYQISNYGRVYHKGINRLISLGMATNGYLTYPFSTNNGTVNARIHRLEMLVFNYFEGCESLVVNHKDGNKLNLFIGNLEWITRQENIIHAFNMGLNPRGEDCSNTSLTNDDVIKICELLQERNTVTTISDITGINFGIIQHIKNGDTWKHISINYTFDKRIKNTFNEINVQAICEYFSKNSIGSNTIKDHSRNALVYAELEPSDNNVDSVRKIYTRKYYTNISNNYIFL